MFEKEAAYTYEASFLKHEADGLGVAAAVFKVVQLRESHVVK